MIRSDLKNKPVLILQHLEADGPAYLASFLRRQGVPFELRCSEAGDAFPDHLREYAALAILGGEMSANDPLPSLRRAERLILQAIDAGQPVIGHCLGGQLMARALGARVADSPAPEVGWSPIVVEDSAVAIEWFGASGERHVFEWHYEAFELPAAAQRLAGSAACPNQAFSIGPHLAMQFHVEIDAEKLGRWLRDPDPRFLAAQARHPTVHSGAVMQADALRHLAAQQALADRLYARWLMGTATAWAAGAG